MQTLIRFFSALIATILSITSLAAAEKILPIYSVDTDLPQVSLTFDVAWGADDFDQILAILDDNNVKATFFIVGDWVEKFPDQVKSLHQKGHDIANHSDAHPHVTKMTKSAITSDILAAHKKVKDLLCVDMDLYRAPYGEYNNDVIMAATEAGYYTIQWDVDSLDWKNYGENQLIDKVLQHPNLQNGSIILLHTGTEYTKDALDAIIKGLVQLNYELVPVSKLLIRDAYYCDHTGRQHAK
ncbi:polysaccharide deacetylase family protein [Candidatus Epulonipiscium viviparus]|uniref:polysaccharide deacetylase family protein n=1 Tax=Candidatus Epulonipiscium viviparus TaxID=420336 RepID=UPI0027380483|nr:polysaccharide deacetylase family protein [Candidatus Epulopiscium viviparus]